MARNRYHHGDLRRALIDAALALIDETGGPHGWSVREAARRAGVSAGAPYRHFADKDALLVAIAHEGYARLTELCAEEVARRPEHPLEQYRGVGVATVRFAAENPAHYRVMNLPEVIEALRPDMAADEARIELLVAAAAGEADVQMDDAALIQLAGQALVYGMARMFVDGHYAAMGVSADQAGELAERITGVLGTGFYGGSQDSP